MIDRNQRNAGGTARRAALLLVVIAAVVAGGFVTFQAIANDTVTVRPAEARTLPQAASLGAVTSPPSFADLAEAVRPAVVGIRVEGRREASVRSPNGGSMDEFFRRFFGPGGPGDGSGRSAPRFQGQGSGFIVDADGLVVTNHHVIADAAEITVILDDGRELAATLRGSDAKTELALLSVDSDAPLPYVDFGDSDGARVGDWVVAVGNPFGLGGTFTAGIISARGRDIRSGPFDDFLQVDAPINRGNSGGPLFDNQGRVIGINTAIFSPNGGNVGIGFAIPSAMARPILEDLREDGKVERAFLGVSIQDVDAELADAFGLESARGAVVATVVEDGPADVAGVEPGDVILEVGGTEIEGSRSLARTVAQSASDEKTKIVVWRDGKEKTLTARLDALDEGGQQVAAADAGSRGLGLRLEPADDGRGVVIAQVQADGPAAREGLRPGDRILRVGRQPVESPQHVAAAVRQADQRGRDRVLLLVERRGNAGFVAVELG